MRNIKTRVLTLIMAFLIMVMSVIPGNAVSISAAENTPQSLKELFDSEFYARKYPEVAIAVGNDSDALYKHFTEYGLNEGRTCSALLNVVQYRNNYPDIANNLDHRWDDIVKHYFTIGIKEGRQSFVSSEDIAIANSQMAGSVILESIDSAILDASNSSTGYIKDNKTGIIASAEGDVLVPFDMVVKEGRISDIEELVRRCGDDLVLIRDSKNRIKFVGGRFSSVVVKDESSALSALDTMADLYKFDTNRNYLKLSTTGTDSLGNPFYRFVSVDGEDGAINSDYTVTLMADKEGNVLGASNSDISSLEYKSAINDVSDNWGNGMKDYYEDYKNGYKKLYNEPKLLYDDDAKSYYWAYYYERGGLVYEVLVNSEYTENIEYTRCYDAESYHKDSSQSFNGDYIFKNLPSLTKKKFIDFYGNAVELPVAYTEGKGWYIVDTERKMVCIESTQSTMKGEVLLLPNHYFSDEYFEAVEDYLEDDSVTSKIIENEKTIISAFTTIQMSYDENKALGMLEKPKTIFINFITDDDDDNASQATFNDIIRFNVYNNIGNADFAGMAHEFGHAVVANQGQYIPYQAATGAINESYADIIGNLIKMIKKKEGKYAGHVDFKRWLIGEFLGNDTAHVIRDMSNPYLNKFGAAPIQINDDYFIEDTGVYTTYNEKTGDEGNDLGGVHQNNSILSHICYRMYNEVIAEKDDKGNSIPDENKYRDLLMIWYDSVIYLHHDSTYADVKGYVLQAMKNHGYSTDLVNQTKQIFDDAKVDDYKPFAKSNEEEQSYDEDDLAAAAKIQAKTGGFDELSNLIEGEIASDDVEFDYEIAYYELQLAKLQGLTGDELKQYEDNLEIARNSLVLSEKNVESLQNAFEDSQARLKKMVDDKIAIISEQEKEFKKVSKEKETNPNLERSYRALRRGLKSNIDEVDTIIDAVEDAANEFSDISEICSVFSDVWNIDFDNDKSLDDNSDDMPENLYSGYDDYPEDLDSWDYYDYWDEFWDAYWEDDEYWYGNDQEWDSDYNYYDEDYSDEDYFSDWYYDDDDYYYYDDDDYYYDDDDAVG